MGINLLKFQTKNGTKLIFDNSSGIVIPENDDTEYLINHIADDKNDIIEELSKRNLYRENEFEKHYRYILALKENGYFRTDLQEIYSGNSKDFFAGLTSQLLLVVTEDCNLRCKYCIYSDFYKEKKTYSSKKMSKETAFKAVAFFKKLHEEKLKYGYKDEAKISFYGGEPLLNFKLIKEVVDYVKKINFSNVQFLMTTNGTLMNDPILDFLARENFILSFSLDGHEENHDRNRIYNGGGETHKTIVNNMIKYQEKLSQYGRDQVININCCFDDYTDMIEVTAFFEKLRKKINKLNIIYSKIYDVDTEYYTYCKKTYNEKGKNNEYTYKNTIKELFEQYYLQDNKSEIPDSIRTIFWGYYLTKNRKKGIVDFYRGNTCAIGDKLCVAPDEKIYICEKANQEMDIGNLSSGLDDEKIQKIYEKYFEIREKHCKNCSVCRLCDACYVHFLKNNELKYNPEVCKKRKEVFERSLVTVYTLMEKNKEIFDV